MENTVKPVKKSRSVAAINMYVLIFSFIPFFLGIGYSIYISDTKSYLSEMINISGSQRMRTMLLSNYSQQIQKITDKNSDQFKSIEKLIQSELTKYNSITNRLINQKVDIDPLLNTTLVETESLVYTYIKNCKKLLDNPLNRKSLFLITSNAMLIKDKFDVLTNFYQSYNDQIISKQKTIDTIMLFIAFAITAYGLFLTKRIFLQEKELIKAKEIAEQLATHDHLTNLPNRRLLAERFRQHQLLSKRNDRHMILCVLDLDNFKHINDNLGHIVGDDVLKETAIRISKTLREHDTISRIGGDEFVLMLVNITDKNDCYEILERIMNEVRKPYIINSFKLNVTLSIGFAAYPYDGSSFQELYENADSALYKSKKAGRNRTTGYDPKKSCA